VANILFPTLKGLTWDIKKIPEDATLIQTAANLGYETRVSLTPDPIWHFECKYAVLRQNVQGAVTDELKVLEGFFTARKGDFQSFLLNLSTLTQNTKDSSVTGQTLIPDSNGVAPFVLTPLGLTYTPPINNVYDVADTNVLETIFELAGVNGNPGTPPVLKMGSTTLIQTGPTTYSGTIPSSSPYQVTISNWISDLANVKANGVSLTLTSGSPASGQYAVASGVYTFNSAQAGQTLSIAYSRQGDYSIEGIGYNSGNYSYPGLVAVITTTITGTITADFSWYYRVRFEQNKQEFLLFSYMLWETQEVQMKGVRQ
jgi:uncharacterized protein DUF2460